MQASMVHAGDPITSTDRSVRSIYLNVSRGGTNYRALEIHGDEQMPTQSNIHFYVNWAKERLDEMDAALTSIESKVGGLQADVRDKANKFLTDLRKQRDDFRDTIKKLSEANEAAWI